METPFMENYISFIIEDLKSRKKSEFILHEELMEKIFDDTMPNESIVLNRNMHKKIFKSFDPMYIVLIGHLYIESLLNEILEKELSDFKNLKKKVLSNTFHNKISYLHIHGYINEDIAEDILVLNNLRNKYAHKLNFSIGEFNVFDFYCIKTYEIELVVKQKRYKSILNRILIKHIISWIHYSLCKKHPYLILLNEK